MIKFKQCVRLFASFSFFLLISKSACAADNAPSFKDCDVCPSMVILKAGSLEMGGTNSKESMPVHRVEIKSFALGVTEITQEQYGALMKKNPSDFYLCGRECPVENVSWRDAQRYIRKLNLKTGKKYRLPTEAEWEYAAKLDDVANRSLISNDRTIDDFAWYNKNSEDQTQRTAQKRPNSWGFYDLFGNVWEWVEDCWHEDYRGAPNSGKAWTKNCKGLGVVLRGGGWDSDLSIMQATTRAVSVQNSGNSNVGFRVAISISDGKTEETKILKENR